MGLVVDSPIVQNNSVIITPITEYSNVGRVCTDNSSSSTFEDTGSFDKTIYRVFSMQDDMKTLVYPERVKNEFDLYIQYAQNKSSMNDEYFNSLDEHLGSIGVSNGIC